MSGSNNNKYVALKFTHEEINNCMAKINNGMVLTKDQYDKLFNKIGLDNISTFDGDFNSLKNAPVIPTKLSELVNDLQLDDDDMIPEDVAIMIQSAIQGKANKEELEDMGNNIAALLALKLDVVEGHSLVADEEIERLAQLENYDDSELRGMIEELQNNNNEEPEEDINALLENKVDKIEGFSLVADAEIERLALVNNFDDSEIQEALRQKIDVEVIETMQEEINNKANAVKDHSLVADSEIAKLATLKNYDDSEIRDLFLDDEPYEADMFNKHYVFACGHPVFAETINEELVITIGSNLSELRQIIVPKDLAAKTVLVGGFGDRDIHKSRHLAGTHIHVKNAELFAVHGGCFFEGSVGKANVIIENSKVKEILGGGDAGKQLEGDYASKNVVFESEVIINNVTGCTLAYAGGGGHSSILGKGKIVANNSEIQYIMPCGAAGMADQVELHINGGNYNYVNQVNRGVVFNSKVFMNAGTVKNFYFGAETEDKTCTGVLHNGQIILNGGVINNFKVGSSNGELITSINGVIRRTNVTNGDITDLVKLNDRPADPKEGDFMFDIVLNKPIFFNGVNWVDSLGFIVG